MKLRKLKPKGFSLIEMLVVIMIILLVLSLGINTYQNQRKQVAYNETVSKVLSMIKTARDYAVSNRPVFDPTQKPGEENYVPKEGYGIYIERNEKPGESKIIFFANTIVENNEEKNQYDVGDIIEEEYMLNEGVNFAGLWENRELPEPIPISDSEPNQAVIIFRPPLAEATLAVNDEPLLNDLKTLTDLYLEFRQKDNPPEIPPQYIHVNQISGIAEINR